MAGGKAGDTGLKATLEQTISRIRFPYIMVYCDTTSAKSISITDAGRESLPFTLAISHSLPFAWFTAKSKPVSPFLPLSL